MAPVLFSRGIRQCIDLTYAAAAHQTIWEYAPSSRAAEDYGALLDQLDASSEPYEAKRALRSGASPTSEASPRSAL